MKSKILAESLQTANKIKFSNDWKYMAGCNNDSKIFVWSFPSYELIDQIDFSENIRDWAISKDSIVVITAQDTQYQKMAISSQIHYYQFSSKDIQSKQGNNLRSIIFTQDSNHIAIGELNRTLPDSPNAIQMYSLPAMEKTETIDLGNLQFPFELQFDTKRNFLFLLGIGLDIWSLSTSSLIKEINCETLQVEWDIWETSCFSFQPEIGWLALGFYPFGTGLEGAQIVIYDLNQDKIITWLSNDAPKTISLSPNGNFLAITLMERKNLLQIFDIQANKLKEELFIEGINGAIFSPDGRQLITTANQSPELVAWEFV